MSAAGNENDFDFKVDENNLYREESITDLKVASIRCLIPINPDGNEDSDRARIFVGHTQLMSPEGPIPIQAELEATNLGEAMDEFPTAMKKALSEVIEKIKQMRQQQMAQQRDAQRIIVPGR
jgi:hypothetical protein